MSKLLFGIALTVSVQVACSFDARGVAGGQSQLVADGPLSNVDPDASPLTFDAGNAPDAVPPGFIAAYANTKPTIDATWDPMWNFAMSRTFDMQTAERKWDTHSKYQFDASITFHLLHDNEFLYLYAKITDSDIVVDGNGFADDDGIWVWVDGQGDMAGPYGADDRSVFFRADAHWKTFSEMSSGETSAEVRTTDYGYDIEAVIPIASDATRIGFNIALADDDGWGKPYPDALGQWKAPAPMCASCCEGLDEDEVAWCDTSSLVVVPLGPSF